MPAYADTPFRAAAYLFRAYAAITLLIFRYVIFLSFSYVIYIIAAAFAYVMMPFTLRLMLHC